MSTLRFLKDLFATDRLPVSAALGKCLLGKCRRPAFLIVLLLLVFSAALLTGCAPTPVKQKRFKEYSAVVWPAPPAPPRIGYIMSLSGPDDIVEEKGFLGVAAKLLLGETYERIIKPFGIAVDSRGRVLVVDTAYKKIHIFDIAKNKYKSLARAGSFNFVTPIGVAVDIRDNIYVTDAGSAKVFVLSPKGRFLFGIEGLERPTGIAINNDENLLYVVDTLAHNVKVYDLRGVVVKTIGARGSGDGEFNFPVDVFVDAGGDVYVTDSLNYRVQVFNKEGQFIMAFGKQGDGTGSMARPKGVAVDKDGNIYIVDAVFDTVQIFNREGKFLLNFGVTGSGVGGFRIPSGIFIDDESYIYVADSYNSRVQVFEYLGPR